LEIARGLHRTTGGIETGTGTEETTPSATTALHPHNHHNPQRPWRCFRLEQKHFGSFGTVPHAPTPEHFHDLLCERIRNAKRRVYLASLYIGPAVDAVKYDKEVELLDAIRDASSGGNGSGDSDVEIKILLDHNRALRPVPTGNDSHTTSAEACRQAIQSHNNGGTDTGGVSVNKIQKENHSVHLFSALPHSLQKVLPNPINEIAGVFHLKAYIIDDELILSGANLSQEYFTDRCDRYLWIRHGGGGLVDCYADLVTVLCQHAVEYKSSDTNHDDTDDDSNLEETIKEAQKQPVASLLESIEQVLTQDAASAAAENIHIDDADSKIVAYAVPTFQAPAHFGLHPRLRSDVETVQDVLRSAAQGATNSTSTSSGAANKAATVRLATAYLNPTDSIMTACRDAAAVHMLTAGRVSHGFKPKNKAGNKGKDWIPAVFSRLAINAAEQLDGNSYLWYYQRPEWTFHAKGIWLSGSENANDDADDENKDNPRLSPDTPLYMVTHGSGNFGARSEHRDMESNLLLFLPAKSPLQTTFAREWNSFCDFVGAAETEPAGKPLAWHLRMALPYIRSFF
jgi:CDP-diacylglycerol--glycerol-3-phosphate 3-phosphatidyltransferase